MRVSGFADEIADDFAEQCSVLASLGISSLDLRSAWATNVSLLDDSALDRVSRVLDDAGISVSCVASPVGKSPLDDDLAAAVATLDRCLAVAQRLRVPYLRLFSFYPPPGMSGGDALVARAVDRLAVLTRRAAGTGVTLLLENEKGLVGQTPAASRDLLAGVDSPTLRAIWDPANFVQVGVQRPFDDGFELLRDWVVYVHVKDARAGSGDVVPAGEGDGQLPELVAALDAAGFDGFLSLEPHLAVAGPDGGFSGAELFGTAHRALTGLLDRCGVTHD